MIIIEVIVYSFLEFAAIAFCSFPFWFLVAFIINKTQKNKESSDKLDAIPKIMAWCWIVGAPITYTLYLLINKENIILGDVLYTGFWGALCSLLIAFIVVVILAFIFNWIIDATNKWIAEHVEVKKPIKRFLTDDISRQSVILYVASAAFVFFGLKGF